MKYRRLGSSGLQVSELSFGSWVTFGTQMGVDGAMECMSLAYDAGVNFFDNAEAYAAGKSEEIMGEALKQLGWPRDRWIVSSKVFFGSAYPPAPNQRGLSRKHVVEACHQALARLQVDYLDLYYCHRPDPDTPIEETVRAMDLLVRQGKVLYWGTSEWSAREINEAHTIAGQHTLTPPTMEQPQYNLFVRERVEKEYEQLYERFGMGTTIWSPLSSGLLTGKYNQGVPPDSRLGLPGYEWLRKRLDTPEGKRQLAMVPHLAALARELGLTLPRFAIAWCLKNPRVSTVILGASKASQLKENLLAGDDVAKLDDAVMARVEGILANTTDASEQAGG
jgi:voltage-dependent potassium channel beta subunit